MASLNAVESTLLIVCSFINERVLYWMTVKQRIPKKRRKIMNILSKLVLPTISPYPIVVIVVVIKYHAVQYISPFLPVSPLLSIQ